MHNSQQNDCCDLNTSPVNEQQSSSKLLFMGLYILITTQFLEALLKGGNNGILEKAGYFLYPISFILFCLGGLIYVLNKKLIRICTIGHLLKLISYFFLLFLMLAYGFAKGNPVNIMVHDAIFFFSLGIFLILGVDDKFFSSMIKLLTVVFWISFVLCLFTYDIPLATSSVKSVDSPGEVGRFTNTVGFAYFRLYTHLALPLFIHGWLEKTRKWHYLQILSLLGFIIINVLIFKFRGALVFSALVAIAAILLPGKFTRKLKMFGLLFIVIIFAFGWITTKGGAAFTERMKKFDKSQKVVKYRLPETERYLQVMGNEWLWGRGLGGVFKYDNTNWGRERTGVHIGWVTFTLKGGLPLLFIILSFYLAWIKISRQRMCIDNYYATAWFWIPITFVNWISNPVAIGVAMVPVYGFTFMLLARFGKRTKVTDELSYGHRVVL